MTNPCAYCGEPTEFNEFCNNCWEVDSRLDSFARFSKARHRLAEALRDNANSYPIPGFKSGEKKHYVDYDVEDFGKQCAGPYHTREEAEQQAADIKTYGGVANVEIVVRVVP